MTKKLEHSKRIKHIKHIKRIKRIGVIGWPVQHSLSPLIFNHWLGDDDRDEKRYEKIAVEPDQLFSFISSLAKNNFLGINITVPHKHHAWEIVKKLDGKIDDLAQHAQSINVISVQDDGTLQASSTDGIGFWTNLKQCVPDWQISGGDGGGGRGAVVLLGAGGAAASLACALTAQGVRYWRLVNRTPVHAQKLEVLMRQIDKNINVDIIDWAQRHRALEGARLLIQATSLGMNGKPALDLALDFLPKSAPVADIVYQPLKTPLLVSAAAGGHQVIDGLGMLIHQAAPVFELWFGQKPKITNALQQKLAKVLSS